MMKRLFSALVFVSLLCLACGTTARRPQSLAATAIGTPAWPSPPLQPRIRLARVIAAPEDLGISPAWWQRAIDRLIGSAAHGWLVRPMSVAVAGPRLYLADPGSQAVWIADRDAGRCQRIHLAGRQPLVSPVAVAAAPAGFYVADSYLVAVFAYDRRGRLTRTIRCPGMYRPAGLAYDASRHRLYVADSGAHCVWMFNDDGTPSGAIGQRGSGPGQFNFPTHVAIGTDGTVHVTDALGFRLQSFDPDGHFLAQFGHHGDASGDFASPKGVAIDSDGNIYVVDALFDAVQIFDQSGRLLLSFGQHGSAGGQFCLPTGLFIDSANHIYVADSYNQRIQEFEYLPASGH